MRWERTIALCWLLSTYCCFIPHSLQSQQQLNVSLQRNWLPQSSRLLCFAEWERIKQFFFQRHPIPELLRIEIVALRSGGACPGVWGSQGRHGLSLLLWMLAPPRGFGRNSSRTGWCCMAWLHTTAWPSGCAGSIHGTREPSNPALPFPTTAHWGAPWNRCDLQGAQTGSLLLFVEGVSSAAWKL